MSSERLPASSYAATLHAGFHRLEVQSSFPSLEIRQPWTKELGSSDMGLSWLKVSFHVLGERISFFQEKIHSRGVFQPFKGHMQGKKSVPGT